MNRLTDIGFQLAGHWLLVDGKLKFDAIRHAEQRNVLYAFVCDGQVRYVGKSIQKLRERMGGYRSPGPKSTTNIRNRQNILELLAAGAAVDIYALPDNGLMHYGSFHLNLAAALEDSIIDTLRPEWNRPNRKNGTPLDSGEEEAVPAGVDTSDSDTGQQAADDVPVDNHIPVVSTFEFTLQPTYWNQGFFNAGVSGSPALGRRWGRNRDFLRRRDHTHSRLHQPSDDWQRHAAGVRRRGPWQAVPDASCEDQNAGGSYFARLYPDSPGAVSRTAPTTAAMVVLHRSFATIVVRVGQNNSGNF
ncbi:GIY-YIG nuclease family protein [Caballeronia sp. SEWSISQ10-4 2]|uniref:GIY-YIG nuclease family protein n=1 Tax=Caballeronia sp. SEWSISQ10-4 2 TaxID=2937438 RepID=UPI002652153B|nr:GIY-YIG nuclease family protein [Caballeronia sp. SEWSISQ10-4 2]MDN7184284.1 GIY-YIG nuclease family protein [Caballeronia sp. SEWSISQ10-4 2]